MIGKEVEEAREAANLTLDKLGLKIGMQKTNLTCLGIGRQSTNVETIYKMAEALICNLSFDLEPK